MADNRRVDFDAIKACADFRAAPAHHGLTPVGKGDQAKIRCPFHDDGEPSRSVNLAKGPFHCFPCHVAGNALDFVHRMETRDGSTATLRQAGLVLAGIGKGEGVPMATVAKLAKAARKAVERRIRARRHQPAPRRLLRLLRLLQAVERVFRAREGKRGATSRSASRSRSILGTRT
jgi:hypothetical protein